MRSDKDNQLKLESLRKRAVLLRMQGEKVCDIANACGIAERTVIKLWKAYQNGGWDALQLKPRGRKLGECRTLDKVQEAEIVDLLCNKTPEKLGLDPQLWSKDVINTILKNKYGVSITPQALGKYLKRWDLIPGKTLWQNYSNVYAYELLWLDGEYQNLWEKAKREKSIIFWISARSMNPNRSDISSPNYQIGKKLLLSATTNQGKVYWMVTECITAEVMRNFYLRVSSLVDIKIILLVEDLKDPQYKKLWKLHNNSRGKIELIYVPDSISSRVSVFDD